LSLKELERNGGGGGGLVYKFRRREDFFRKKKSDIRSGIVSYLIFEKKNGYKPNTATTLNIRLEFSSHILFANFHEYSPQSESIVLNFAAASFLVPKTGSTWHNLRKLFYEYRQDVAVYKRRPSVTPEERQSCPS
jgi:hypothetical protein